ncbi:PKD domain-containing protein [Flavivirga sp. 57AJ16]|uniref:PKD domain-containing protein n=1 Tax=Flavivirga sp. 57AJ16 TaxID=3025307 RepID=UPI0023655272|nr:PKD domain-containing protein [Flavivirga sp. 57AJ16]MDD7888237.1 PKD domain-containing protein [Flavivirga sp. 57AJ16]
MKKLKFFYYLIAISLLAGCGTDNSEEVSNGGIIADFSYSVDENDPSLITFTNLSQGATNYRWDFGDLSFYCDKENPVYRYTKKGGDLNVTLTAMNESGQEANITKPINTPEVIKVNITIDGDFGDWEDVDVLVDDSAYDNNMQILKLWGGGDYLNVYIEGKSTMLLELLSIFINTDGNSNTGYGSWQWGTDSGADFLFQGPIGPLWWGDCYKSGFTNELSADWTWNWVAGVEALASSNIVSIDANTNAIEFSISKSVLGGNDMAETISVAFAELNSGWGDVSQIPNSGSGSSFVSYRIPVEALLLCE